MRRPDSKWKSFTGFVNQYRFTSEKTKMKKRHTTSEFYNSVHLIFGRPRSKSPQWSMALRDGPWQSLCDHARGCLASYTSSAQSHKQAIARSASTGDLSSIFARRVTVASTIPLTLRPSPFHLSLTPGGLRDPAMYMIWTHRDAVKHRLMTVTFANRKIYLEMPTGGGRY